MNSVQEENAYDLDLADNFLQPSETIKYSAAFLPPSRNTENLDESSNVVTSESQMTGFANPTAQTLGEEPDEGSGKKAKQDSNCNDCAGECPSCDGCDICPSSEDCECDNCCDCGTVAECCCTGCFECLLQCIFHEE